MWGQAGQGVLPVVTCAFLILPHPGMSVRMIPGESALFSPLCQAGGGDRGQSFRKKQYSISLSIETAPPASRECDQTKPMRLVG